MTDASVPVPTALARAIDLSYPSNRWAVLGLVSGVVLGRLSGRSWVGSAGVGLSAFAAWATARELDPDHALSANLALPLTLAAALLEDEEADAAVLGDLLAAFTALSSARVLSATVGEQPGALDEGALGAMAAMCAGAGQNAAALLPGAALTLAAQQPDDCAPQNNWAGPAALIAGLLPTVGRAHERGNAPLASALIAGALLTAPRLIPAEPVSTETDRGDAVISAERVRHSRLLALGGAALGGVLGRSRAALPLAAAALSVGLLRQIQRPA